MSKVGIEAVKAIVVAAIEIGNPVGKALADGKIKLNELFPIGYAAISNIRQINEFITAWAELRDLDEGEKQALYQYVADHFGLPKFVAEKRAEAAFKFLLAGAVFYHEWDIADDVAFA